jgi:hypothetical protein
MPTKKKDTPTDRTMNSESVREAQGEERQAADMWDRLIDLGSAFQHAAVRYRRDDFANVGLILHELAQDPDFREAEYSSLQKHLSKKFRRRMLTRRDAEEYLLSTVAAFMAGHAGYTEIEEKGLKSLLTGEDLLTERLPPFAEAVARLIVSSIRVYPALYGRTQGPPLTGNFLDSGAGDDDVRAVVERVREAIAPSLDDPDDAKPESVVKAAMRALGVDPRHVKDMFQQ